LRAGLYGEAADVLSALVAIPSVNPDYPDGSAGEDGVARFAADYLQKEGIETRWDEVLPGRHNLIAFLPGKSRAGLCLETHMDTVSALGMRIPPFSPEICEGKLYGRGSCDAKASLAAMMCALAGMKRDGIVPATDTYLAAVVDEEYRYRGVTRLLQSGFRVQSAVVGEPTNLRVVTACKGVVRFTLAVRGKSGHSSRPRDGRNAIYDMAPVIAELENQLIPALGVKRHPLLGSPTLSIGRIEGGVIVNIIPDRCVIEVDRRTLPGEDFASVSAEIQSVIDRVKEKRPGLEAEIEPPVLTDDAMDTPADTAIARCAAEACSNITGNGSVEGVGYCCDATKFSRAGIPAIVLGPGDIRKAHAEDEYVSIAQLEKAVQIYKDICINFSI
jgi:acetylornithine deacetylase